MTSGKTLHLVVCAAPVANGVEKLDVLRRRRGVHVIPTALGFRFIDADRLASLTGEPARSVNHAQSGGDGVVPLRF